MGLQKCPKCKEQSFTWFIGGKFPITIWSCFDCDYEAKEVDSDKTTCENCGETAKIKLKDKEKEYCYCNNCNIVSDL